MKTATEHFTALLADDREAALGYYEVCVNLMDDDLREDLHSARDWDDEQEPEQAFLTAYAEAHLAKFDEDFIVN